VNRFLATAALGARDAFHLASQLFYIRFLMIWGQMRIALSRDDCGMPEVLLNAAEIHASHH
jgi:hypothetical protein